MGVNWVSPKVETRKSTISGKGTFTKTSIKKGELIIAWGGDIIDFNTWKKLPENVKWLDLQIDDNLVLSSRDLKNVGEGDYINHSCEPNSGIKGQIFLVTMKDINKNEEITFDYAMVVSGHKFRMECNCMSKSCRKVVTGDDWKNPKLQKRYKGYFSYYLQQKIDDLNAIQKTS